MSDRISSHHEATTSAPADPFAWDTDWGNRSDRGRTQPQGTINNRASDVLDIYPNPEVALNRAGLSHTKTSFDSRTGVETRESTGEHRAFIIHEIDHWSSTRTDYTSSETIKVDRSTGRTLSADARYDDGRSEHITFDPQTGRMQTCDVRFANGNTEKYNNMKYNAAGIMLSQQVAYSNGDTALFSYNPKTQILLAKDLHRPDGTKVCILYSDPCSADHANIVATVHPDGTRSIVEYDHTNVRPRFVTVFDAQGHRTLFVADAQTGALHMSAQTRDQILKQEKDAVGWEGFVDGLKLVITDGWWPHKHR